MKAPGASGDVHPGSRFAGDGSGLDGLDRVVDGSHLSCRCGLDRRSGLDRRGAGAELSRVNPRHGYWRHLGRRSAWRDHCAHGGLGAACTGLVAQCHPSDPDYSGAGRGGGDPVRPPCRSRHPDPLKGAFHVQEDLRLRAGDDPADPTRLRDDHDLWQHRLD